MTFQGIGNPKGAFGYQDNDGTEQMRSGNQQIVYYRNVSTVAIPKYSAVILSSLASDGTGVVSSTVIGSNRFIGIAQDAMTSQATTVGQAQSSNASDGEWGRVCVAGPCWAAVSTGTAIGDVITNGNSTLGGGNALQTYTTLVPGTVGAIASIAGWCLTSATTGTTGSLSTVQPRAKVFLRPTFFFSSTA